MPLSAKAIEKVRKNKQCKNRLALELDKSVVSIERWLRNNSDELTMMKALNIIVKETGMKMNEVYEP